MKSNQEHGYMDNIRNKFTITLLFLLTIHCAYAEHLHSESSYQHAWAIEHNGEEEFINDDYTRVDCLTDTHAVEFDFADK